MRSPEARKGLRNRDLRLLNAALQQVTPQQELLETPTDLAMPERRAMRCVSDPARASRWRALATPAESEEKAGGDGG